MDRNRKILVSILAMLVLSSVIAIVDISITMKRQEDKPSFSLKTPQFGPGIGLVRISGPIEMSSPQNAFGLQNGAEGVVARLNDLEKDSRIKAVVIRIDSPGGTVAATQEIYQKIWKIRKKNIPVIASMGDIAASGGYYVASACNYIMANHGTMTGSIGVIAMSPNVRRLFEKLGISMNVIKSGKYKDTLSSYRDISADERQLLQEMIDSSYRKFLRDVALGRSMNQSEIKPYADGRVFTGTTALKHKLIDGLGTFEAAIAKARELAKLPEDAPLYEDMIHPFQKFLSSMEMMVRNMTGNPLALPGRKMYENHYRMEYRYLP